VTGLCKARFPERAAKGLIGDQSVQFGRVFLTRPNKDEAAAALKLNEIIESAIPEGVAADKKARGNIKAIHFYNTKAVINGEKTNIEVIVREHLDGKRYYDHYEIKERPAGLSGEPEINQESHQPFTDRSTLPNRKNFCASSVKPAAEDFEQKQSGGTPSSVLSKNIVH
jgi:hypothetical protein